MKKITLFLSASIFCLSQDLSQNSQNLNNSYTFTSASFFNYGTSGYEIDGFIEFQIKNRFFIESSINYEIGNSFNFRNDHTLSFSSSIGAIKNITKGSHAVGGFSNYTERNNDYLNELFVGIISKHLTDKSAFSVILKKSFKLSSPRLDLFFNRILIGFLSHFIIASSP